MFWSFRGGLASVALTSLLLFLRAWPALAATVQEPGIERTNLLAYLTPSGQVARVKSIADWQQRRTSILSAMQKVMGPLPGKEKRCSLEPRIDEEVDCGSYIRRRISYASEPGARVPAYLLVPKKALESQTRRPAILA